MPEALQVVELLDLRGPDLAIPRPIRHQVRDSATAASRSPALIHASAHTGEASPRAYVAGRSAGVREATERLDMWQVAGSAQVSQTHPQPAEQRLSA